MPNTLLTIIGVEVRDRQQDRSTNKRHGRTCPAIHVLTTKKDVDGRHKAGHDEQERS
jgi:hypothetical protein